MGAVNLLRHIWIGVVQLCFRLLYNQFAWAYDWVSRAVSRGEWRNWQRASLPYMQGPRVLEIAFGTGDLILDLLADHGQAFGIDLSPAMVRIASRKLQNAGRPLNICRGRAQELPFADGAFSSIAITFPAPFILDPASHREIRRVLATQGRLVIVDRGLLRGDAWSRFLNWTVYSIGANEEKESKLISSLESLGFSWQKKEEKMPRGLVKVWVRVKE